MRSLWARVVYIFNLFILQATDEGRGLGPYPLPGQRPPSVSDGYDKGPVFRPPSASQWVDIKCNYTEMIGYKECSTDGDRSCWLQTTDPNSKEPNYTITTDYENLTPKGITRKYYIEVEEKEMNLDGVLRNATVINGTYPGPWIQACWGDDIEVTVKNKLKDNGTTIHWHGIRQLNSNAMDGVNAITQCPTAPNQTFTYKFKAMQYGTSWYHSHYSLQYGEGALGPLTIHGPSSADYDEAKSPVMMSDWSHISLYTRWAGEIEGHQGARRLDNILLNGTGTWNGETPNGKYTLHFTKGRRYLLRLINTSVDTSFVFAIENHKIQVISADFVPIVPYMTDHVVVGIGQRYHVIITANPIDGNDECNYWIRTYPATGCAPAGLGDLPDEKTKTGVIIYKNDSAPPKNMSVNYNLKCRDEPYEKLVPILPWKVGKPSNFAADSQFDIGVDNTSGKPFYPENIPVGRWNMYSDTMWLDFSNPTLAQLNPPPETWDRYSVIVNHTHPKDNWVYLLVSGTGIPRKDRKYNRANHPIHLHGHDFAILQQSTEKYQIGGLNLNLDNPPRRDVAFMPGQGFLVLAFKADNPGAWLMHCHIAFHASGGLAIQILENPGLINISVEDQVQMKRTCDAWKDWKSNHTFLQDDSGI